MAATTFTKSGNKATTTLKLNKDVFGVEVKSHELLKQAYSTYLANGRLASATTKKRGEVRGGGRKPWRQKGTGRARFGSTRNPIWRGGGIVFGPSGNENYSHKLPLKAKRQALRQAFSLAAKDNKVKIIESFENKELKTKFTIKLLEKIEAQGNILLLVEKKDEELERATRNVVRLKVSQANYANVFDIMNADTIVITKDALVLVHAWLNPKVSNKEATV